MKNSKFIRNLWSIAKPYKWWFSLSYIILVIELVFSQAMPLFLGKVIDAAVYKSDMLLFLTASAWYAAIFIGQQSCSFIQLQFWQALNNKYVYGLRMRCYKQILSFKAKYLTNVKTGDMVQAINRDTMEFHHILQRYAMRVVNAGLGTIISLVIVIYLEWEIAIIIAILIPTSVLLTDRMKKKMKIIAGEVRDKQGSYNSWLLEIFKGFREIKLFAAEKTVIKHFVKKNDDLIETNMKQVKLQFKSDQTISLIYFISQLVFYIVSAVFVVNKSINIAQYISIAAYYNLISSNFQMILLGNAQLQARRTSVERVFALLENDIEDESGLEPVKISAGSIRFDKVSFAYNEDVSILKNISCDIIPGEKFAIVGESGVGKSTFVHLLMKFLSPDNGTIKIDGQDVSECTYSSIRKNVGIVSQETTIFDATIKDNICFDKNVPEDLIWSALEKAYLKSEIEALPDGIHTILGKDGVNLSGGQNQRLSIARMIYKNPKIIILDEATSALDEDSEKVVQNALDKLTIGRTSIVVSHRLNSIINANRILVLKDGEMIDCGAYHDLIEKNTTFNDLFGAQARRLETGANEV